MLTNSSAFPEDMYFSTRWTKSSSWMPKPRVMHLKSHTWRSSIITAAVLVMASVVFTGSPPVMLLSLIALERMLESDMDFKTGLHRWPFDS